MVLSSKTVYWLKLDVVLIVSRFGKISSFFVELGMAEHGVVASLIRH